MDYIILALFRVTQVRLEDVLKAFNSFTHKAGNPCLLWVSEDSVGGRRIEHRGSYEDAALEWVAEGDGRACFGYCVGYDPAYVTEVEFTSATSGSVLRWTRYGHHHLESVRSDVAGFGDFEYRQGRPNYEGGYWDAFQEVISS